MFVFFFPVHFPRHIFIGDNFFSLLRRHTQNTDLCVIFGANTQVMAKTYARAWGGCARANGYRFESTATLGSNCNTNCQLKYEIQRACSATRKKRYFCTLRALSVSLGSWDVRVPAIAAAATPKLQSESITKMRLIQFYCLEVFSREHEDKKYTFDPKAEIARERARFCVRTDLQLLFLFLFEANRHVAHAHRQFSTSEILFASNIDIGSMLRTKVSPKNCFPIVGVQITAIAIIVSDLLP